MNNRIKELAVQADLLIKKTNGDEFRYGNFDPKFEKFAESIIKECADLCTHEGPFTSEVIWGKQFRQQILKHFGVE